MTNSSVGAYKHKSILRTTGYSTALVGEEVMLQTHLYWSHLRWQPEAHVIAVNHDDSTNHASAHAKAGLVHKLAHACLIQELSAKCLCKVGPQIVCGTCLNTSRSDRKALTPSDIHKSCTQTLTLKFVPMASEYVTQ